MLKNYFKGGGTMERKEHQALTPAGRVSQQENQIGGGDMRDLRMVWGTIDAANRIHTFLIVEFVDESDYEEFWSLPSGVEKSVFLSEKLEGKRVFVPDAVGGRELEFPPYFDGYGRKNLFWYNNVYETYGEAYERLVGEWKEGLSDYYGEGEEEALEGEARERAEEELNNLPVVRI
jgi:hypothetical protein